MLSRVFYSKRTAVALGVICAVLPVLLAAYGYFNAHRPPIDHSGEYTAYDYFVMNLDILLGLLFLLASAIPFMFVYDRRRAQARDLVPISDRKSTRLNSSH